MSRIYEGWVTVTPAPGEQKSVAKALLELAESPHQVRTTGDGSGDFLVPQELADAWRKAQEKPARKRVASKSTTPKASETETETETPKED